MFAAKQAIARPAGVVKLVLPFSLTDADAALHAG
jgi:hypothetical protein